MTAFWWFFEDFRRFYKIVLKARRTFRNIFVEFPKMSEDCRRLSRKTRRCFDGTPTNLSTIQEANLIPVKSSISSHVRISYLHMWGYRIAFSGAPAARRTTNRSSIPIEETKGNPWIDFLMIALVSGIARGRVRSDDGDGDSDESGFAHDGGHPPNNSLTETCNLGLPCLLLIYDIMLW